MAERYSQEWWQQIKGSSGGDISAEEASTRQERPESARKTKGTGSHHTDHGMVEPPSGSGEEG